MGVLKEIRNKAIKKVSDVIKKGAGKVADGVAVLSQLSPNQVEEIDNKRIAYLSEMPKMDDEAANNCVIRNLDAIATEVYNAYLPQLSKLYLPIQENNYFEGENRIRYFEIAKWAKDPDENNLEKLMNVYQVLSEEDCNIALIFNRSIDTCTVSLAVVNNGVDGDPNEVKAYRERLMGALRGNFPGAELITEKSSGFGVNVPECLRTEEDNGSEKDVRSVAIVSNLATEKSEKFISQTIEKVIDGIVPEKPDQEYTIVLLATPVKDLLDRKDRLYELYSMLAPYATWQTNYNYTDMSSIGSSGSAGGGFGVHAGSQSGQTTSTGMSDAKADSVTGTAHMDMATENGVNAGGKIIGVSHSNSVTVGGSLAKGITKTLTRTATEGINSGNNLGANIGLNFARSSTVNVSVGKNEGITRNFINYNVKHTLDILEKQVKRLEESAALGLWDFAAYVMSVDSVVANNVAHTYLALTQGEESFFAEPSVNLWRADLPRDLDNKNEKAQAKSILNSLERLQHPEFALNSDIIDQDKSYLIYPTAVDATVSLSGKELARSLNFPNKSISGLPVVETAAFGRGVSSYNVLDKDFSLGQVYHMHKQENNLKVELSKKSMTSHVFITGSTGTGKTNTTTGILKKIVLDNPSGNIHFMVIEPAKGEYKDVLGGYDGVKVYGTNPNFSLLLRINPFSFPKNITVTEHIDRLVEIFNVCWPMYAAMPAILKDAVIRAYEEAGWDVDLSVNILDKDLYPGFVDVMNQVREILKSSEYSSDAKGDYTGALLSRLKSLTNGINGHIFTTDALSDKELFDKNVIVDMSRVGSSETKALIMGILVLKLQEYRLSAKSPDVSKLEHITVLEEAHNLLRRTSIEQSSESANLLGKSVEMLTNSIAELRAFGEGFIIADQAPGLLDIAVIRNTNTKIVHRLPERSDRELVGRAMGMSDSQIKELAKLECGVAAVYQNDWIESVLCKVDEFKIEDKKNFEGKEEQSFHQEKMIRKWLVDYLMGTSLGNGLEQRIDLERLCKIVMKSQLSVAIKREFLEYLKVNNAESTGQLLFDLLSAEYYFAETEQSDDLENWLERFSEKTQFYLGDYSKHQVEMVIGLLIQEQFRRDGSYRNLYQAYTNYYEGKVL